MRSHHGFTNDLREAIGALDGVEACGIESDRSVNGSQYLDIVVNGWSPSLHRHQMRWSTKVDCAGTPEQRLDAALDGLSTEMDNQRARIARAALLGHGTPLPLGDDAPIGHLGIDAGLGAMLLDGLGAPLLVREIRESIVRLNDMTSSGWHDALVGDDSLDGTTWSRRIRTGAGMHYDGRRLEVEDVALPDSVLSLATGRRVGEIAKVPAAITDHVVAEASVIANASSPPRTVLLVEARTVTLRALIGHAVDRSIEP